MTIQLAVTERQCVGYHRAFTGLVKCPCKPLRIITYVIADEPVAEAPTVRTQVSGDYCAKHAIELRRDEARGKLEILSDEPLYPMPFDKPVASREIGTRGFYGV